MALQVAIIGSVVVGSGPRKYTSYTVQVTMGRRQWTVARRFNDFALLDSELRGAVGCQPPTLPTKGLVGLRHALNLGSFNQRRQESLEQYLEKLVSQVSSLVDVPHLVKFLGLAPRRHAFEETAEHSIFNKIDPLHKFGLPRPIFKVPKIDIDKFGDNGIVEVAFGEAEDVNGVEVTVIFKDEDRPNHAEDVLYDAIRKPLFGRCEDVETFTFIRGASGRFESILFKGTYAGDQGWSCQAPAHLTETVALSDFSQEGNRFFGRPRTVVWINVWNHLFGPTNNNVEMEIARVDDYPCTHGTRKEVDARYHGLLKSVA